VDGRLRRDRGSQPNAKRTRSSSTILEHFATQRALESVEQLLTQDVLRRTAELAAKSANRANEATRPRNGERTRNPAGEQCIFALRRRKARKTEEGADRTASGQRFSSELSPGPSLDLS